MNYNINFLKIKYALINSILVQADSNILDISYCIEDRLITIQMVLLEKAKLSEEIEIKIRNSLPEYDIKVIELQISKDKFNETRGEWLPKYYNWIGEVLFSKAEVL